MGNYAKSAHGDYDVRVPSMGQVNYNTVGASAGIASFLGLNADNVLGGFGRGGAVRTEGGWHDHPVSRYEMALEQKSAAKDSEIALLKATIYEDQKSLELYKYIDGKLEGINAVLAKMAVENQRTADTIVMTQNEFRAGLREEAEKRCCADNSIVNYLNNNFYAKEVADVTVGTTTTAQTTYNPLPKCNCF